MICLATSPKEIFWRHALFKDLQIILDTSVSIFLTHYFHFRILLNLIRSVSWKIRKSCCYSLEVSLLPMWLIHVQISFMVKVQVVLESVYCWTKDVGINNKVKGSINKLVFVLVISIFCILHLWIFSAFVLWLVFSMLL